MVESLFTLLMLIMLQAVLGFDNLLYITLESKRAPKEKQKYVRTVGIAIAMVLRIVLLFVLVELIKYTQDPFWHPHIEGVFSGHVNLHSIIVLVGGGFIIYTAIKEIWHMLKPLEHDAAADTSATSVKKVITLIVIMNLVFSFDSILSAMALAKNPDGSYQFTIMAIAIICGGLLMIWLADKVADFLAKNRLYEVLGLFILFVVGIMLVTEGGHLAHLKFFGEPITPMTKTTFYFVIAVLVVTDIVQGQYQKKLERQSAKRQ